MIVSSSSVDLSIFIGSLSHSLSLFPQTTPRYCSFLFLPLFQPLSLIFYLLCWCTYFSSSEHFLSHPLSCLLIVLVMTWSVHSSCPTFSSIYSGSVLPVFRVLCQHQIFPCSARRPLIAELNITLSWPQHLHLFPSCSTTGTSPTPHLFLSYPAYQLLVFDVKLKWWQYALPLSRSIFKPLFPFPLTLSHTFDLLSNLHSPSFTLYHYLSLISPLYNTLIFIVY